jgi:hypothetical protein
MNVLPKDRWERLAWACVFFLGLGGAAGFPAWGQCPPNSPVFTPTSWNDHNGSATSTSPYTVVGQGSNSQGQSSESGYADLTTAVGNGQIVAEVLSVKGTTSTGSAAGIFIRSDVTAGPDGPLLWIDGTLSQFYQLDARIDDKGLTEIQSGSCSPPYWLMLQNSGYVFYPSMSTDGSSWTPLPAMDLSADTRFSVGTTLAYGIFAWSGSNSSSTTAVFGQVCVNSWVTPYPTLTPNVTFAPTDTLTPSPTMTGSSQPTATRTPFATRSPTATLTPTPTMTGSPQPTATWTISPNVTFTPTPSRTGSPQPTATWTSTATVSPTPPASYYYTPTPTPSLKVWPNPFTPQLPSNNTTHFSLPSSRSSGRLLIADLRRRQVRSISFQTGADVQWDGRDNNGNIVSSGVYLYLLESDGAVSRGTVTVMR